MSTDENVVDGGVDRVPFIEQLEEGRFAFAAEPVKPLVPLVLFAPLACQQSLRLQAAQERIEGAFVDLKATLGQSLSQRVAVMLLP